MDTAVPGRIRPSARWIITVVSLIATASSFLFINGVAFLIPSLQTARGIPLDEAGLLSSMPSWGMVVTLVLWGYVLDRVGERIVMTLGSGLTAAAAYAARAGLPCVVFTFKSAAGPMVTQMRAYGAAVVAVVRASRLEQEGAAVVLHGATSNARTFRSPTCSKKVRRS